MNPKRLIPTKKRAFQFRLSDEDLLMLKRKSQKAGRSGSEYLRDLMYADESSQQRRSA